MANTSKNTSRTNYSVESIEALEEIIRNCHENEQRLHALKRHARHERKKAEHLLRETYRMKYEQQPIIPPKQPVKPSIEYFLSFDDDDDDHHHHHRPRSRTPRVRFNLPPRSQDEELADLSRRCEDLLVRLHTDLRPERDDYHQPFVYQDMKRATKKKYDQLPEVNERLQRDLNNEIKRRNVLRAKIFRLRLRQHVLLHGRADIDESLTMIDT